MMYLITGQRIDRSSEVSEQEVQGGVCVNVGYHELVQ
jgi:hypothetical protein